DKSSSNSSSSLSEPPSDRPLASVPPSANSKLTLELEQEQDDTELKDALTEDSYYFRAIHGTDPFSEEQIRKWSKVKIDCWKARHSNPNAFYYRFTGKIFSVLLYSIVDAFSS